MRISALVILLTVAPGLAHGADWVRLDTPNFVIYSQAGEKRTREVAHEFERFREAMQRVFPNATASPVPTTVVVFDSRRAFVPYHPRHNGKPVQVAGYFVSADSENMIALTFEERNSALRTIFHEYTHLITASSAAAVPTWLDEGLAEFYSTFAVAEDGSGALLGRPIRPHYGVLARGGLLPLEQLLAVDESSALYNEGQRRSVFYAQSWVLVHILLAGEPNRSKQLADYMRLTAGGASAVDAWRQAFAGFDASAEVKRFIRNPVVLGLGYAFHDKIGGFDVRVSAPGQGDVEAVLASLLRHAGAEAFELKLQRAADSSPRSPLALALLGSMKAQQGDVAAAAPLLFEATRAADDWMVHYYAANALAGIARAQAPARDEKIVTAARGAIEAVLRARPQLAHALALKAGLEGGLTGASIAARATALAPGRDHYIYLEAGLRAEAGDYGGARKLLASLLERQLTANVRENAQDLLRQVMDIELAMATQGRGFRIEGALEAIGCPSPDTVALIVRTSDEVVRFAPTPLRSINVINRGQERPLACGDRSPPDRVAVTWERSDSPAGARRPVVIEFLRGK